MKFLKGPVKLLLDKEKGRCGLCRGGGRALPQARTCVSISLAMAPLEL